MVLYIGTPVGCQAFYLKSISFGVNPQAKKIKENINQNQNIKT